MLIVVREPSELLRRRPDSVFEEAGERSAPHELAAVCSPARPELHHPVGARDQVEAVLDDQHAVAPLQQPAERLIQHVDVGQVQTGRRLVEEEQPAALLGRSIEEARELQALRLAARERRSRLAEAQIAEANFGQGFRKRLQEGAGGPAKSGERFLDGELRVSAMFRPRSRTDRTRGWNRC